MNMIYYINLNITKNNCNKKKKYCFFIVVRIAIVADIVLDIAQGTVEMVCKMHCF